MEPIEQAEDENDVDASEQAEPSSNSSGYQIFLSNPFEVLLQSSSDDEVENELSYILRIDGDSPNRVTTEEAARFFNTGLPIVKAMFKSKNKTEDGEKFSMELLNCIRMIRQAFGNVVLDFGPFVTTWGRRRELEKMKTRNGLGPFALLSHRLYYSYIWMFRYDGSRTYERLSDVQLKMMSPLMFAALTSKPSIVHFLMKYGTRFIDETHGLIAPADDVPMRIVCMRVLLTDIIRDLLDSEMWDSDALKLKTDLSSLPEGLRLKCLNFRLLLRCDPNPYVTTVKLATLFQSQVSPLPEMNVLRHIYDSLFPNLGLGLFNPPLLQHMCRCVIRRRLHENWQLPDGISQLELPKILCDYVNLLDD